MESVLLIQDQKDELSINWNMLYAYCGPSQLIASALFYRLAEQAFKELSPLEVPKREDFAFLSAFPGRGILECIELTLRLPSLAPQRLHLDLEAGPEEAPKALQGRFYFEIQIADERRAYYPAAQYFDEEFLHQVKTWQHADLSQKEYDAYMKYKWAKAKALLEHPGKLFHSSSLKALDLEPLKETWYGHPDYTNLYNIQL